MLALENLKAGKSLRDMTLIEMRTDLKAAATRQPNYPNPEQFRQSPKDNGGPKRK